MLPPQSPSPAAIERALANGGARPEVSECGSGPHDRDDDPRQAGAGAGKERLKTGISILRSTDAAG